MNEQTELLDDCLQVDAERWEIYDTGKLIGYFESDGRSYDFKSCAGPAVGGNGQMFYGTEWHLRHCAKTLRINYWRINRQKEMEI